MDSAKLADYIARKQKSGEMARTYRLPFNLFGFAFEGSDKVAVFSIWCLGWFLRVKDTRKHFLLFSQRNGYTGRTIGNYHIILRKNGEFSGPLDRSK